MNSFLSFLLLAHATQPKMCNWFMEGLLPHKPLLMSCLKVLQGRNSINWTYDVVAITFTFEKLSKVWLGGTIRNLTPSFF
jgi:hypothetical protein